MSLTPWKAKDESEKAYRARIAAMTDDEYLKEADNALWFSAFASNNPRCEFHAKVDALYDEAVRRGNGEPELYSRAYDELHERMFP